jgi:Na+-transporting NADH:ubiquinone oxidoreductase subunit NqrB
MVNARNGLVLAGLAFGTWEFVDIFWISTPAVAAVMAALFLSCTIWYWRRDSMRAAVALLVLFVFEGAVAPTLKAMTVTKALDLALALVGIGFAATVIVARRRGRTSPAVGESRSA